MSESGESATEATVGVTVMVMVTVAPEARVPMSAVRVLPESGSTTPTLVVAESKITSPGTVGRRSVRTTPVAAEGPLLTALTVKIRG